MGITYKVDKDEYYKKLFVENSKWSEKIPNHDEIQRMSMIFLFISKIIKEGKRHTKDELRILDVGCGRGWQTNLLQTFGNAEGVDPIAKVIQKARKNYPDIVFHTGTIKTIMAKDFREYDLVVASEIIEHVEDKTEFVRGIRNMLCPNGFAIITTPRKKLFKKWQKADFGMQPIEVWLDEKEVKNLFKQLGFKEIDYDRVYVDIPRLSLINRICASKKATALFLRFDCYWIIRALMYRYSIYQIWCFQKKIQV